MFKSLEADRLLYEAEAAEVLSIKVATLRRWRYSGDGPRFIKLGAAVRYDPQELRVYLAQQVRSSTSDRGASIAQLP